MQSIVQVVNQDRQHCLRVRMVLDLTSLHKQLFELWSSLRCVREMGAEALSTHFQSTDT
jgi:hypothetical protein